MRRRRMAPALVAVALLAAACGDDGGQDAAQEGGEAPAAAEPFGTACAEVPASGAGSFEAMMTAPVAEAAAENPLLTTLVMDLELAGLVDTLNSAEDLTVFAPTNAAFETAAEMDPEGTEMMMDDPTGEFADLLSYHVVEGQIPPDQLAGEHTTLQGEPLTVEGEGETFTVNGTAMVVCGDVHTDNATVYIVDEILHPGM